MFNRWKLDISTLKYGEYCLESEMELSAEDFRTSFCEAKMLFTSLLYSLLQATQA